MILHDLISYDTLRLIWWVLLGVLLIAFALADGFDLGACALLPFVARTDGERRQTIDTVAPVWEGNQVWLILGGGAIFAAWPPLYSVSFSGFYMAMFVLLAALILRPVAFKYRSKRPDPAWRARWDWALFVSGVVPALIFGVAVGNVLLGAPFRFNADLLVIYEGGALGKFLGLLGPFALLTGALSLAMLVMHGAAWVTLKTDGPVRERARRYGSVAALAAIGLYILSGLLLAWAVPGYRVDGGAAITDGPSNPLMSTVTRGGSWLDAYATRPWIAVAPAMGIIGAALTFAGLRAGRELGTMAASKIAILGMIASVGLTMFPIILPSSIDARSSLLVWNASSSHLTLFVMLVGSLIFLPIILAYTAWVYRVLWGKVPNPALEAEEKPGTPPPPSGY